MQTIDVILDPSSFNVDNIQFSEPVWRKNVTSGQTYPVVKLSYVTNDDKGTPSITKLQFSTGDDEVYCFGASVFDKSKIDGSSIPLNDYQCAFSLHNRDAPTSYQRALTDALQKVDDAAKKFVMNNKALFKVASSFSEGMCHPLLSYKKDEAENPIIGLNPTIKTKLMGYTDKKTQAMIVNTEFIDSVTGKDLEFHSITHKPFNAVAAFQVEEFMILAKTKLYWTTKLRECYINFAGQKKKRLLQRRVPIQDEIEFEDEPMTTVSSGPPTLCRQETELPVKMDVEEEEEEEEEDSEIEIEAAPKKLIPPKAGRNTHKVPSKAPVKK